MTRTEYVRRYAVEMMRVADVDEAFARENAESFYEMFCREERSDYPEDDAHVEMSYWDA